MTKIQLPLQLREGILLGKSLWMLVLKSCRCAPAVEAMLVLGDAPGPSLSPHWRSQLEQGDKAFGLQILQDKEVYFSYGQASRDLLWGLRRFPSWQVYVG